MDEYARFSRLYDPVVGPFLKPIHRSMVAALTARECRKTIDLCCGTGMLAGMAANTGLRSVGVDLSPAMLHVAREKHPNVTFIDGDATSLIFSDGEFDGATISFALHEKPLKVAFGILAEALRVVRKGGLILVADYRQPVPVQSKLTGLAINIIERLAGKEHHEHYTRYMQQGGSESFLSHAGLIGLPAMTFMNGWAGLYISIK